MSTEFEVEPEQLALLARDLSQAVSAMRAARQAMEMASGGSIGVDALDSACGAFHSKWGYGLKQLGSTAEALATGLSETAQAYLAVEAAVAKSMGGNTGVMRPVSHGVGDGVVLPGGGGWNEKPIIKPGKGAVEQGAPVKSPLGSAAQSGSDTGGLMKGVGDQVPVVGLGSDTSDPFNGPVLDPRELWGAQ